MRAKRTNMRLRPLAILLMASVMALSGASVFGNSLDYDESEFVYLFDLSTKKGRIHGYKGSSSHVTIPSSFTVRETYKDDDGETHTRNHTITVTDIDRLAFADRKFITSVSFHSKLKVIGNEAFRGCTGLKSFRTPSSLNTLGSLVLSGCTGLETAEIDGDNLVVGENLFRECTSLRSVVYGPGVTKIGGGGEVTYSSCWAFNNCTNLVSIVVESTAVRCIPDYFCNVSSLTHLSFAGTITDIGQYALRGCTGLTSIDATLRPTSIGNSAFYNCTNLDPHIDFSDCTGIGNYAFYGCRSMTGTLSLPKLSTVSFEAFYGCLSITGISFESVEAIGAESFYNCKSLALISLPVSLRTIGRSAFYNCTSLASVSLPDSLRSIDSGAFKNCTSLQSVLLPDSLASLGSEVFSGCTGLETAHVDGNGSLRVGSSLFNDCTNLETVIIGTGVKSIEDGYISQTWNSTYYWGMFAKCNRLKKVEIRTSKLPKLPSYMFRATPVEEVYIAGGCNELGDGAFSQCTSLTEVTGDFSSVTNIARNAFEGCSLLAKVPSVQNVEIMGSYAFYNCQSMTGVMSLPKLMAVPLSAFYCCRGITGVNLGSATTIDSHAFCGCWALASVSFSSSLKTIGTDAFQYCYALASVALPDSLKSIGSYAFQGCRSLKSFKTPHSLKTLDDSALIDCIGLESAEIDGDNLHVGRRLFSGCTSLRTVVYGDGVASISGGYIGNMGGTYYAFSDCTNLKSIMVRSTAVREIPMCLCSVPSLTTISFAGVITNIGQYALRDCTGLTCIDATMRPTSIGNYAFYNCTNLDPHIDFSDCTSIGSSAFYNCRSMTGAISLPKLATTSSSVFSGCSKIESVQFGADLTSIGSSAFSGCTNAFTFAFAGTPPSVGSSAFNKVKSGAIGTYTAEHKTEWKSVINADGTWNGLIMSANRPIISNGGCNVAVGEFMFNWGNSDAPMPSGMTYEIRRGFSDNYNAAEVLTNGYVGLSFVDKDFYSTGGVSRIWYWVKPEHQLFEKSEPLVAKNRYLLTVGYTAYDPSHDRHPKAYSQTFEDVKDFRTLCLERGRFTGEYCRQIENARTSEIRGAMQDFALLTSPGDIFIFYIATHGSDGNLLSGAHVVTYDANYSAESLHEDLRRFNYGVAVVNIICTCHSAAMTESTGIHSWINRWLLGQQNVAWIASCDTSQDTLVDQFGESFVRDGWRDGYADKQLHGTEYGGGDGDGKVTLGELGRYARVFSRGLSDFEPSDVQLKNENLLDRIVMEEGVSCIPLSPPDAPVEVSAAKGVSEKTIRVSWKASVRADRYFVYRASSQNTSSFNLVFNKKVPGNQCYPSHWWDDSDRVVGIYALVPMLRPFEHYVYRVQAVNPVGFSELSEVTADSIGWRGSQTYKDFLSMGVALLRGDDETAEDGTIEEYASAESMVAPNGFTFGNSWVAGLDPTNETSKFTVNMTMTNGVPYITWSPNLNTAGVVRTYTTWGKTNLIDAAWIDVTDKDKSAYRFFKVTVDMP